MTESTLQIISILKLLCAVGCSALYAYGGMDGKWKRRFVFPAVLVASMLGFSLWQHSYSWWLLLCVPLYSLALSIGYGSSSKLKEVFKSKYLVRAVAGMAISCASLPLAIIYNSYLLWALHTALFISVFIILGAKNPISARGEETIIGAMAALLPLFMIGGS